MEEVVYEIRVTEANLKIAGRDGDASSRDFLRTYLIELQKIKNLLLQQQRMQLASAQSGNYPVPLNFLVLFPSHNSCICTFYLR